MTRFKKIIMGILAAILVGMVWFGYVVLHYAWVTVPNGYAAWAAAGLINKYVDSHEGAWPRDWNDLRQTYASTSQPSSFPMADIEARVNVDWKADPRALACELNSPIHVVWLKDGSKIEFGVEPNELIWNHLRARLEKQPAASSASTTNKNVD